MSQARESEYKVFSYLKREGDAIYIARSLHATHVHLYRSLYTMVSKLAVNTKILTI
jgi:hypothetical protein